MIFNAIAVALSASIYKYLFTRQIASFMRDFHFSSKKIRLISSKSQIII
jgi:hypothetical protein